MVHSPSGPIGTILKLRGKTVAPVSAHSKNEPFQHSDGIMM